MYVLYRVLKYDIYLVSSVCRVASCRKLLRLRFDIRQGKKRKKKRKKKKKKKKKEKSCALVRIERGSDEKMRCDIFFFLLLC